MTPKAVARNLDISIATVYRLIRCGDIPAIRVGGQYRILAEDLDKYIERLRVAGPQCGRLSQ